MMAVVAGRFCLGINISALGRTNYVVGNHMDSTEKPQLNNQQQLLDSINAGHGIAIGPASTVCAAFERLQRIYSEGDAVKVTGHMKTIRP